MEICDICKRDDSGSTDDSICWSCVDAAEEITGKVYVERRTFWTGDGGYGFWEDMAGNRVAEKDALINWPSRRSILIHRGIVA